MPHILHLVDASDPEELRLALKPLIERPSSPDVRREWQQFVAVLSGRKHHFSYALKHMVGRLPLRFGLHFLSAPALKRCLVKYHIDLIHAWSLDAAYLAALGSDGSIPILLSRWDPQVTAAQARQLLAVTRHSNAGVLGHSAMVQRRMIECGLPTERCAIIRPGVDFAVINKMKRTQQLREELQIEQDHIVVLLPPAPRSGLEPPAQPVGARCAGPAVGPAARAPSRRGGYLAGAWATEAAARLEPRLLLLLPALSRERDKRINYFNSIPRPPQFRATGNRYGLEQLLGVADVLLVPAAGDISTTAIAWAMAAAVPILGCASYCIAELIADGHNGHLVKPNEPMLMAGKLLHVVRNRPDNAQLYDRARAQAFESFGLSRYVEQVQHAYENVLSGQPVSKDLIDSATYT